MDHRISREVTLRTGREMKLQDGSLVETGHDWFVSSEAHRFECQCGQKFNTEERAIEHLTENGENKQ